VVGVALGAAGDVATISVSGGNLTVGGEPCTTSPLLGETATTRNTEVVRVRDISGGPVDVRIADPAAFAPGLANEGDGSAEIEFGVDLGEGPGDILRLEAAGPDAADRFELGNFENVPAANFNARREDRNSEDVDLGMLGVERVVADGRALDDKLDARGGSPFSAPLAIEVELFGLDGEDELGGGSESDLIHGGPGDDLLVGGAGRDVLLGGGEEDVLAGGEGPDRLDGGDDDDLVDYRLATSGTDRGVLVDLGGGRVGGAGRGDRLVSVEGAFGSPFDDVIVGSGALNFIEGGNGDDRLVGLGHSDALLGSAGDDLLEGGGARDIIIGGAGADRITGAAGKDVVVAGADNDRVETGAGVDVVDVAGGGRDIVDCGGGRDGFVADSRDRLRSCEVRLDG